MSEDSLESVIGPSSDTGRYGTALVLVIGITSDVLYLLLYLAQQAIYLNGLFQVFSRRCGKGHSGELRKFVMGS